MGVPRELILKIKEAILCQDFVETGTFQGDTCFWAKKYFDNVYTIEISEEISKRTASKPDCPENIQFLVGDSKDVLPKIVGELGANTIFWFDGHYSGPGTGGEEHECVARDDCGEAVTRRRWQIGGHGEKDRRRAERVDDRQ